MVPCRWIRWTCGMYFSRFQDRSSVSTNTTFGRFAAGAAAVPLAGSAAALASRTAPAPAVSRE
ncbi:MAG: hypothetical protein ACJ73S_08100 [Mycobacteriales bacterium]